MRTTSPRVLFAAWVCLLAACPPGGGTELPPPVSPTNHRWFPIAAGTGHEFGKTVAVDGVIACESCHPATAQSFTEFQCVSCHKHSVPLSNRLHLGVGDYAPTSAGCYQCHPTGEKVPFSHQGIATDVTGQCAECHQVGAAFAALPKPGFTHSPEVPGECGGCHQNVLDWADAVGGASRASDPARDLTVDALQASWVGTTIVSVAADRQVIPMSMNHQTVTVDAGILAACANCHAQADQGQFYPGVLHFSLIALGAPQPAQCLDCHDQAAPKGFVGTLDPRRSPQTGEMKHDAVLWDGGVATSAQAFALECQLCHQPPINLIDTQWTFAAGRGDGGIALFHASLTAAGRAQPQGCLDCHANTRPIAPVVTAGLTFDHSTALGECSTCHRSTTQWSGGQFHFVGAPAPASCLPCHAGDRPTSTTGWMGNFLTRPFDAVTNVNGVTHGADQDCAVCHPGPGTGAWGINQNWRGGTFSHAATTIASTTCIACHTTQRPDLLVPPADAGYDHALSGTGDCFACHQATVTRGSYQNLLPIPGGDWRGGQSYPGDLLISTTGQSRRVLSTTLNRAGALVTGMTTATANLPNAFLHTSAAIPTAISPGSAAAPDQNSCWHCHVSSGTTVTAYANGFFHAALSNFRVTPASPITPLSQPTSCDDCHATMRPPNIVSKTDAGTPWLLPMDHSVAGVPAMDCGSCHRTPGPGPTRWSDGVFHTNVSSPPECVSCHFPLMTTPQADVTADGGVPQRFAMRHRSASITNQACASCHATALARSTQTPTVSTLWKAGAYHPTLTTQPAACLECHGVSDPVTATQSLEVYSLPQGGTATNGGQWMNHQHPGVTGRDCATCHRTDARQSGSAWSRSSLFHANSTGVTGCSICHGPNNMRGAGNNNVPAGLIDSVTVTTSSAAAANTHDQISHTDLNVTRVDCNFCHTQVGPSTVAGVQDREWTKAVFHRSFTSANPMVVNGTTARCNNCHLNVAPGPAYTQQSHAAFLLPGAQDCASCHSWPGTNPSTPNWLGATGAHAASGPTATSPLDCNTCHGQGGNSSTRLMVPAAQHFAAISNGNKCTSCHVNFAGFKDTVTNLKYAHTNAAANGGAGCVTCHAFSSQLCTTLTNTPALTLPTAAGGHQFSQTQSVTGRTANCGDTSPNGCFTSTHANTGLTRCGACHQYAATTATTNVWAFKHRPSNPGISNNENTAGCTMCH